MDIHYMQQPPFLGIDTPQTTPCLLLLLLLLLLLPLSPLIRQNTAGERG